MLCGENYEEELEKAIDEDYNESYHQNDNKVRSFLLKDNWALDKENGVALGFDEDVELQTQEYGE